MAQLPSQTHKKYIDLAILLILSSSILYPTLFIVSTNYEDFIRFSFAGYAEKLLSYKKLEYGYSLLKVFSLLSIMWFGSIWFDFLTVQKKRTSRFLNRISEMVYDSLRKNILFIVTLEKKTRMTFLAVFLIFFLALLFFVLNIPLHYDEMFSFRYFSSKGIWTSLSFYPLPNNHVFYNIITSLFVNLPLDEEISVRLPAFIASLIAIYYVFKIGNQQFGGIISMMITVLIICLYPFIIYSINARGYAFVNLFCVLLMYASIQLQENLASKKYRGLFIISGFLGMLSVPSFLYTLFPIYITVFIYLLTTKSKTAIFLFIKDCLITGLLIILGYGFILLLNNPENLTNPNGGATKFSFHDNNAFQLVKDHLKDVSNYLFGKEKAWFLICLATFMAICYSLYRRSKKEHLFATILSFAMIISPVVILCLHRVIPFTRIWVYLVFPFGICIGFIVYTVYMSIKDFSFIKRFQFKTGILLFSIIVMIYFLANFENKHRQHGHLDYQIATLRKEYLNAELRNIKSIAHTKKGIGFYPAEVIWDLCYKLDRDRWVSLSSLDSITDQDLLIIDKSDIERFKPKLSSYHQLNDLEDLKVFYKNK